MMLQGMAMCSKLGMTIESITHTIHTRLLLNGSVTHDGYPDRYWIYSAVLQIIWQIQFVVEIEVDL